MSLETLDGTGSQDEQLGFLVEGMDCALSLIHISEPTRPY